MTDCRDFSGEGAKMRAYTMTSARSRSADAGAASFRRQTTGVVHPDAVLTPGDPQQSAPMQPLQRVVSSLSNSRPMR